MYVTGVCHYSKEARHNMSIRAPYLIFVNFRIPPHHLSLKHQKVRKFATKQLKQVKIGQTRPFAFLMLNEVHRHNKSITGAHFVCGQCRYLDKIICVTDCYIRKLSTATGSFVPESPLQKNVFLNIVPDPQERILFSDIPYFRDNYFVFQLSGNKRGILPPI